MMYIMCIYVIKLKKNNTDNFQYYILILILDSNIGRYIYK